MAPKNNKAAGKGKGKDASDDAGAKGKGKGGLKAATSINVRHILVCITLYQFRSILALFVSPLVPHLDEFNRSIMHGATLRISNWNKQQVNMSIVRETFQKRGGAREASQWRQVR